MLKHQPGVVSRGTDAFGSHNPKGDVMVDIDRGRRATLRDVARDAGVSVSTVSKVLNDRRDVGSAVRERVLATVAELGYRPNGVARGLRLQRSQTIALISDDLEGIFTSTLMRGVEDAAARADVAVFL